MTEPEYMNETPGADWIYVDEGTELTTEQATRQFLDQPWPEQLRMMERMREDLGAAAACRMLNHEGAMIFATQHTCQTPEPQTVEGEIVTAGPQSIEPKRPAHECEDWMIVHPVDHAPYCSGCGSYVA